MNKIFKYLLLIVGGLAAVLIAVLAYVAATFNPNDHKPQLVQVVKDKLGRTLRIDGDIKLVFYPSLGAELGGVTLSERGSEKEFAAVRSARVSLQLLPLLSRQVVVNQVEVRGLRANLVKRRDGSTNVDDLAGGAASGAAPAASAEDQSAKPVRFNIDHVLIDDANLAYADEGSGAAYALGKLTLKTGPIVPGAPSDIDLAFALGGKQPKVDLDVRLKTRLALGLEGGRFKLDALDLDLKGAAVGFSPIALRLKGSAEGDAKAIRASEFSIELDATQDGRAIKAKLASPLAVDLAAQTVELGKLVASAAVTDSKSARGPLSINATGSASADLARQHANLAFTTKFDESTISGKLGLSRFSPPAYVFDLNVDKLDVDRYAGAAQPAAKSAEAGKAAVDKPEAPLDLSALKSLQASGSIKVGALTAAKVQAQNVRVEIRAGGGRVDLNPLAASLYQGNLNGSVSVLAMATPQIAVKQNLTGISIGPLLKDALAMDMLEGKGNVALDVSGSGATVSAIKKALNGSASLNLADGAVKGINIAAAIRSAQAKLGAAKGEGSQAASAAEKTDFTELKASFTIRNGVAHNADLSLKSPLLRLGGEGDINIGTNSMDYLAKATLVATAAGQGGKDTAALKGITIPVRIAGPFNALNYKLDFNAMIGGAAQQKIESAKEDIKAKAQGELKNQLRGLFRK